MDEITSFFKVKRNIVNTLLLLVMVAALPLGINLARQQQILRSRAAGDPIKFTGQNVEKRADKWVAIDRNKPITLELISSLGPASAGGSGGGSSPGGGSGSSTFQSLVPNGITAEQITAEANQIIGSGNWKTEENQFKLRRNLFEKYFGREGDWLTPQQITKFLDQRTDIGAFVKGKGVEPTSYGIILGEWFPGGSRDTDGLRILLQIAREDNGKPITTPDQVLAMVGIKEKIISMMGGPEGSRDWPATRFLREWFKIQNKNNPDQNAINALRIMSKMPGQTGFTIQEYPNLPQAFTSSQTTSLPALMSLIPKGLVGEVKALVPGPASCDDDVQYWEGDKLIWKHGGYWDSDIGECVYAYDDVTPQQCTGQQFLGDTCISCETSQATYQDCFGNFLVQSSKYDPNCTGLEWCNSGPSTDGGHNIPPIRGVPCAEGYPIQCDAGNGQNGIQICKPGIVGSDGTCQFDEYATNCYGLNTATGEYDQYGQCNAEPNSSSPGTPSPGTGGTPGARTGTQCPALTCEYSEVDSSCPSGYRIAKGIGATGFNESGCTYKEGCSTSQCAPGDSKKQPPSGTKPAGTTPATSSPPKTSSPPTSGAPKTSGAPSGSPGTSSSPGTGTGTVTTVSYKIAENPDELSSAPEQAYTGEPMIVNFDFKDKSPGNKFVWVEYKDSKGKTARHSAQIRLLGDDPKIGSCFLTFEGQNALVIITNPTAAGSPTFGKEKGSVQSGSSTLQIREWTDKFVSAVISNIAPGTSVPITLTTADGQKADAQCGSISGLSLGAKVFCRAPQKHDTDNVDMTISEATPGASVARQKVRVDKDGNVQNLQTKLIEGRKYKVSLKAPRSLKRTVEFTAGEGITNLQNFVLPVGDIFPLDSGDGKINSLDKAELNRQWVTAQSASGRSGDFNQDTRINSIDWACMRYDFGKSDD